MSRQEVSVKFEDGFKGTLVSENGTVKLGRQEGGLMPYNLLLGGLASCLYATFLDIVEKKKISYDKAEIDIVGIKREEVPTTLEDTTVVLTITGADEASHKGLSKSLDLSAKYCSIYQTIAQVSKMHHEIKFQ